MGCLVVMLGVRLIVSLPSSLAVSDLPVHRRLVVVALTVGLTTSGGAVDDRNIIIVIMSLLFLVLSTTDVVSAPYPSPTTKLLVLPLPPLRILSMALSMAAVSDPNVVKPLPPVPAGN